jgi:ABC-2 type transport system permease protein
MVLSVLLRNEMLKMVKRLAFVVTLGFFLFIMIMEFGGDYYRAIGNPDRVFSLPGAWRGILTEDSEIALIFGSVILILLMSSEFSWRTARQNVIDGLSKEQFFIGKTLLVPIIGLLFVGSNVLIGGVFALAGTDFGALTEPLMRGLHWSIIGGFFLAFLGYGSLALFCSLSIRNSGPAMAVWFFYIALGEQIIAGTMNRIHDRLGELAAYLPVNTFNQLHRYFQFDSVAFQQAVQRAVENDRTPPGEPWAMGFLLMLSVVWIAVLVGGSFFWFRKRDL